MGPFDDGEFISDVGFFLPFQISAEIDVIIPDFSSRGSSILRLKIFAKFFFLRKKTKNIVLAPFDDGEFNSDVGFQISAEIDVIIPDFSSRGVINLKIENIS